MHNQFIELRGQLVLGRGEEITTVMNYVQHGTISDGSGSGRLPPLISRVFRLWEVSTHGLLYAGDTKSWTPVVLSLCWGMSWINGTFKTPGKACTMV